MNRLQHSLLLAASLAFSLPLHAAGKLEVVDGWIRSAPPSAPALAGYGALRNSGDAALTITAVSADGYAESSLHESVLVDDVSRMQALPELKIPAGETVVLAPGGKHLMLMQPSAVPQRGDSVKVHFQLADGSRHSASLVVRDAAATTHADHAGHEHQH